MSDALKPDDELPRSPHHVLDELKSVLSNLGQHAESAPSIEPIIKETPVREEAAPLKPAVPSSSDADFWSGNVLGWPTGTEAVKKEPIPEPIPVSPPPPPPPPSPSLSNPPQQPPVVAPDPMLVSTPQKGRPPWPVNDVVPEPPSAPPSPEKLDVMPASSAFAETETSMMGEPEQGSIVQTPSFPIPRTVEESTPAPIVTENPLFQVEAAVKPKDLVQLACFFPEGNDKIGQQFAKQLRDAGSHRVPSLVIEPVLISSWSASDVDMNGWIKSAQLSGADIMFILAPRQEMKLFQNNPVMGFQSQLATRIVATEHVSLRTLYADIMIELKRRM